MQKITSRFRLSSSAFERADEENKSEPKKMVILSVEGDETERTYFQHLNEHLDNTMIQIEVLRHRRGDGYSDPTQVIELLDEYMNVRQGELIPNELVQSFAEKYTYEVVQAYLAGEDELTDEERKNFKEELLKIGIDLEYRQYLLNFNKDTDYFAVVLDRDYGNHSRKLMQECIENCRKSNYGCFVSNPCFEFWLLLHLCDVKSEFSDDDLEALRLNHPISNRHTRVSLEVSKRAHHNKTISAKKFEEYYFTQIPQALVNAGQFVTEFPQLLDNLGTNLPKLFDELNYTERRLQ